MEYGADPADGSAWLGDADGVFRAGRMPIESASETLQRIFDGHGSVLGSQMADESSRYDVLLWM